MPLPMALRSVLLGYCPNCLMGHLFEGALKPRLGCDVCSLVYERDSSTWLGCAFIMYLLACLGLAIEGLLLALLFGFFPGFVTVMGVSAVLMIALVYRPSRALWIWCLWKAGYIS